MSKEIKMTPTIQELKLISEATHDKEVRNSVTILVNHILRTEQGWTDEDFEIKKRLSPVDESTKSEVKRFQAYAKSFYDWCWGGKNKLNQNKYE